MKFMDNLAIRMVVFIALGIALMMGISYISNVLIIHEPFTITPFTIICGVLLGVGEAFQYDRRKNKKNKKK
ncbi:MAG: hypothetical protein Q4B54_10945 [Coriobacteriales bacterium]|nr:hypothetical protein [Coriobacteriales bacterium]